MTMMCFIPWVELDLQELASSPTDRFELMK